VKELHPSVSVSKSSVYRTLKNMEITYKKRSKCRRHKTIDYTHPFMKNDDSYDGDAIAFDESGFYWNDFPSKGWGKRGDRVPRHKSGPNNHVSLLLAVGREGVVHKAVLEGGVGGAEVAKFFEGLPNGRPVILDHPNIHRGSALKEVCRTKGIELRYTPHYSPWYNPVEFCFSEIKSAYRPMRLLRRKNHVPDIIACVDKLKGASNCFDHAKREWLADKARAPA
jgi:transposase